MKRGQCVIYALDLETGQHRLGRSTQKLLIKLIINTNKGRFLLTAPGWEILKYPVSNKMLASLAAGIISDMLLLMLLAPSRWAED